MAVVLGGSLTEAVIAITTSCLHKSNHADNLGDPAQGVGCLPLGAEAGIKRRELGCTENTQENGSLRQTSMECVLNCIVERGHVSVSIKSLLWYLNANAFYKLLS